MKNLFYKEVKLCLYPVTYIFMFLFPLLILVPNYPIFISFIYICSVYPFIFLGANKGQSSNDLLYSVLLPIRKRDVVKGRMMLITSIQIIVMVLAGALSPLAIYISNLPGKTAGTPVATPGLDHTAIVSILAFAAIGFAIYDFIYFVFFYKKGKSILAPTLIGILTFSVFMLVFTLLLPILVPQYREFFTCNIGFQFLFLLGGLIIAAGIKILAVKIGGDKFEKADF